MFIHAHTYIHIDACICIHFTRNISTHREPHEVNLHNTADEDPDIQHDLGPVNSKHYTK